MKKYIIASVILLFGFSSFSQNARKLLAIDTLTGMGGKVILDTSKVLNLDTTLRVVSQNSYQTTIGLNPYAAGYWLLNTLLPTKIYTTYRAGIGTDTPYAKLQVSDNTLSNATYDSLGILLSNEKAASSGNQSYSPPLVFQGNVFKSTVPASSIVKSRLKFVPIQGTAFGTGKLDIDFLHGSPYAWNNAANFTFATATGTGSLTIAGASSVPFNINSTVGQIDYNSGSAWLTLSNSHGATGIRLLNNTTALYVKQSGSVLQTQNGGTGNFAINDLAALTVAAPSVLVDIASASLKGVTIPRVTNTMVDSITSSVLTLTITPGSGHTNGVYNNVVLNSTSGAGTGLTVNVTVSGGAVTLAPIAKQGINYVAGEVISIPAASIGGTGSGAAITVATTRISIKSNTVFDSTLGQYRVYLGPQVNTWTGDVKTNSLSTQTLRYGTDYIFTGTTTTWTLPAVTTTVQGRQNAIYIKNRGSGSITLNSNAGSTLYNTAAQSSITVTAGSAVMLMPDGTYFNVMFNL
jgi:hypothetical protein